MKNKINKPRTVGTLFSGIGGSTLGAIAAGYKPIWAIDHDIEIGDVYRANLGDHLMSESVVDVSWHLLPTPDLLLASPPCCNFSGNKVGRVESEDDYMLAKAVLVALGTLNPKHFVLENVPAYRNSKAFRFLHTVLIDHYPYYDNPDTTKLLCATRFEVPQTRKRMVLRYSHHPLNKINSTSELAPGWGDFANPDGDKLTQTTLTAAQKKVLSQLDPTTPYIIQRLGYHKSPKAWPADKPIGTISAHGADDGKGHSREHLTLFMDNVAYKVPTELVARLSGLPRDFIWSGVKRVDWRGIGNIFHPQVSEAVCRSFG